MGYKSLFPLGHGSLLPLCSTARLPRAGSLCSWLAAASKVLGEGKGSSAPHPWECCQSPLHSWALGRAAQELSQPVGFPRAPDGHCSHCNLKSLPAALLAIFVLALAQVLSPLAKGLFHKAISESGTATMGLFTEQPNEDAQVGISGHFKYFSHIVCHIRSCSFQNTEIYFSLVKQNTQSLKTVFLCANRTCWMMCCLSNTQISTKKRREGREEEWNVKEYYNM